MALDSTTAGLLSGILDSIKAQTRTIDEQFSEINERRDTRRAPFRGKTIGEINRERKAAEKQAMAYAENAKKIADASDAFKAFNLEGSNAAQELGKLAEQFRDSNVQMSDTMREQVERMAMFGSGGDITSIKENMGTFTSSLDAASKEADDLATEQIKTAKATHKITKGFIEANKVIENFVKESGSWKGLIAGIGASAKMSADAVNEATRRQVPLMDLTAGEIENLSAAYGISARDMMQVTDEYTATILANAQQGSTVRGAVVEYLDAFKGLRDQARDLTGSYEEANKLVVATFSTLSRLGIDTTFKDIQDPASDLMKQFQTLARITGRTAEEEANLLSGMLKEQDMRNVVLQQGKDGRLQYVERFMQDKLMFKARGMEIEQAEEAAKALGKLTTEQDPREIYANAAKIAQVAGAIGVEGGQEFMREMMKPAAQRDNKFLEKFATEFKTAQQEALGKGPASDQAMSTFAMTAAVGGPVMDLINQISTAGMEGQRIDSETLGAVTNQTSVLTGAQGLIQEGSKAAQRIEAFLKEPAFPAALAAGMGTTNLLLGTIAANTGVTATKGLLGTSRVVSELKSLGSMKGLGALGAAAFAVTDAYTAITTGDSQSYQLFKGTVVEDAFHGLFEFGEKLGSWAAGGDFSTQLEKSQERMAALQEETNQTLRELKEKQEEQNRLTGDNVAATKQVANATEESGNRVAGTVLRGASATERAARMEAQKSQPSVGDTKVH